jgi:hypothetical protein
VWPSSKILVFMVAQKTELFCRDGFGDVTQFYIDFVCSLGYIIYHSLGQERMYGDIDTGRGSMRIRSYHG